MVRVLIWVGNQEAIASPADNPSAIALSPTGAIGFTPPESERAIAALKQAIAANPVTAPGGAPDVPSIEVASLPLDGPQLDGQQAEFDYGCLLTSEIPPTVQSVLPAPLVAIGQRCQDVVELRRWVASALQIPTRSPALPPSSSGRAFDQLWLPIVLTAKGALYGEVIGGQGKIGGQEKPDQPSIYFQPLHLPDRLRQPLYRVSHRLLHHLTAPPSVYLLQFGFQGEQVCFDRLFPYPAPPALASLGVQEPDLYTCYWRCLTGQPILDLVITSTAPHQVYEGTTD